MHSTLQMVAIMIASSMLSTMNVWADTVADIRLSLNDVYMATLMTGWMVLLTGCVSLNVRDISIGAVLVASSLWCIRKQVGININQYYFGMIPHHSMAVFVSKQALSNPGLSSIDKAFLTGVVARQRKEIEFMRSRVG
jgi:hypothetical protein